MKSLKVQVLVFLLAVASAGSPAVARSQDPEDKLGTWLIYNGTLRFTDHWSIFTEAQLRAWEAVSNLQEWLVRLAGQYHFTRDAMVGVGYLYTESYPFEGSGRERHENRIYEQLGLWQRWGRAQFEHRYRVEQRWLKTDDRDFSSRARYRFQVTTPLNRRLMQSHTWFLNVYDEIFVTFDNPRLFDQNRLYGAGGYQFTELNSLQLGLLWQLRSSAHFLRLQIFYTHNFDFRRAHSTD